MGKLTKQALMYAENLTLPSFQVIVVNGNLGCAYCGRRVSQLISKMSGLREYTVDVRNKQVILKGDFKFSCSNTSINDVVPMKKMKKNDRLPFKFSINFLIATCIPRCFSS
ncbi:unnamed protein product [Camellia sinensis]